MYERQRKRELQDIEQQYTPYQQQQQSDDKISFIIGKMGATASLLCLGLLLCTAFAYGYFVFGIGVVLLSLCFCKVVNETCSICMLIALFALLCAATVFFGYIGQYLLALLCVIVVASLSIAVTSLMIYHAL